VTAGGRLEAARTQRVESTAMSAVGFPESAGARAGADDPGPSKGNYWAPTVPTPAYRPVGNGMAKLLRAHLAIPLAVSLTLFAQLLFVHASCPQFPTLASTMNRPGVVLAMVVRLYLDASRPNHDTL
jgi:hypothetical protein